MARFKIIGSVEVEEDELETFMAERGQLAVASNIEAEIEYEIYSNLERVLPSSGIEVHVEEEEE